MYVVHKRTLPGPDIAFYYIFKFQRLVLQLNMSVSMLY